MNKLKKIINVINFIGRAQKETTDQKMDSLPMETTTREFNGNTEELSDDTFSSNEEDILLKKRDSELELEEFETKIDYSQTPKKFFIRSESEDDEKNSRMYFFQANDLSSIDEEEEEENFIEESNKNSMLNKNKSLQRKFSKKPTKIMEDSKQLLQQQQQQLQQSQNEEKIENNLLQPPKQTKLDRMSTIKSREIIEGNGEVSDESSDSNKKENISEDDEAENIKNALDDKEFMRLRDDPKNKNNQCLIYPDDSFKAVWDSILTLLLLYTIIFVPYRIAFYSSEDSDIEWEIAENIVNGLFALDIFVNFFSAYFNIDDKLITEKKKIAFNYITSWFLLDSLAILPFDLMIQSQTQINKLVRVARLPRLYKVLRVARFFRILKVVKERHKIFKHFQTIGKGARRLFLSLISMICFCHLATCIWILIADLSEKNNNWIVEYHYTDSTNYKKYLGAFYWVGSTVVTVGYGDITAQNTYERILSIFLMFGGVFFYSFTIGTLSSLLSELDAKEASFDLKLSTLIQIKKQFNISESLYKRIKRAMKYGHRKSDEDNLSFLNELPMNLRIDLSYIMYKDTVYSIDFFKNKPKKLIGLLGPHLKPIKVGKNECITTQGDYANEMYFIKRGRVAIVLRDFHNFKFMSIAQGYYFGEVSRF